MYEDKTYESIMEQALDEVSSDVDKREGSLIYDAIGPCAFQLAQVYFGLGNFINLVMLDTAVGDYLDRKAAEFGVTRKFATAALRSVSTSEEIGIGTRWELNGTVYKVSAKVSENSYSAVCETVGTIGNEETGELVSLDSVVGVTATLGSIITPGTDDEDDEALRERVYEVARKPSASGNVTDYKTWAKEVSGVGDAKVFPTWAGAGTVKVLIVDSNKDIDTSLENDVAAHIETCRPIGATVTVDSPDAKVINVTASVILSDGGSITDATNAFKTKLQSYLRSLVFNSYTVSYARIGSMLLESVGVTDYTNLSVNSGTSSIPVGAYEAPVIGSVTLTEVI